MTNRPEKLEIVRKHSRVMFNIWYDNKNIQLQMGLNVLHKDIWTKISKHFIQDIFYYIVQVFCLWLNEADFIILWLLLFRWTMWPLGLLFYLYYPQKPY